jgi:hypothetical protein
VRLLSAGLWNYEGKDGELELWAAGGVGVHDGITPDRCGARPLYRDLVTNLPKTTMAYADFDFEDDVPEYPHTGREHVLRYVRHFALQHSLGDHLELGTVVRSVRWAESSAAWEVTSAPPSEPPRCRLFANVVVASGHHSEPLMPELPGQSAFPGRVLHSCSFDAPEQMAGLRVLVLGGSVSAGQIAEILQRSGLCAAVAITTRAPTAVAFRALTSGAIASAKRSGVKIYEELAELRPDGSALFIDDAAMSSVDVLLAATGYKYSFPFLDEVGMNLIEGGGLNVLHMWRGLFFTPRPSLTFIGLHHTLLGPVRPTFFSCLCSWAVQGDEAEAPTVRANGPQHMMCWQAQLFEHQARYVSAVIQGRGEPLPSQEEMERELAHERSVRPPGERLFVGLRTEMYCQEMARLSGTRCTYRGRFKGMIPPPHGEVVRLTNPLKQTPSDSLGSKTLSAARL